MTVDAEQFLLVQSCKDLAEGGLAAPSFTDQEDRLVVGDALVDEDGESE